MENSSTRSSKKVPYSTKIHFSSTALLFIKYFFTHANCLWVDSMTSAWQLDRPCEFHKINTERFPFPPNGRVQIFNEQNESGWVCILWLYLKTFQWKELFHILFPTGRIRISSRSIGTVWKSKCYSDFPIIPLKPTKEECFWRYSIFFRNISSGKARSVWFLTRKPVFP